MQSLAVDPAETVTAVATSATALVGVMVYWVSRRSHAHELAVSGTKGALVVGGVRKDWRPPDPFATLPAMWERDQTRYFGLRVHNRGPYETAVFIEAADIRVGRLRHRVDGEAGLVTQPLAPNAPITLALMIHKADGWRGSGPSRRRVHIHVYTNIDDLDFHGKVWIKPLPPEGQALPLLPSQPYPPKP